MIKLQEIILRWMHFFPETVISNHHTYEISLYTEELQICAEEILTWFVIDPDELTLVFIIYIADMNICYRGQMIIFGSLT